MTPVDVAEFARQQYNAVNDSFFADEELYRHIWHAQNILAREAKVIENTYTTTTVASQQEYTFPTNAIAIKRITWNGMRLTPITFREDDWLTGFNAATTSTGTPSSYAIFDRVIYLRPLPSAAYTLKLFTFDEPGEVSSTSTLDVPTDLHLELTSFLLWKMSLKDQNFDAAQYYEQQWKEAVLRARAWARKRQTADSFRVVRDEEALLSVWEAF